MNRSSGLLHALLVASPLLFAGCDDTDPTTRPLPEAEIEQPVPDIDTTSAQAQVASRAFGDGFVMFELDRAIEETRIDFTKTRLMTVRPDAQGALQVVEAAGDMFLDATGTTIAIELADEPRAGDIYRAVTVIDGVDLDLATSWCGRRMRG